jgi:hydroxymethylglutaryl-CoA synthase
MESSSMNKIMQPRQAVGIIGYGAYIPRCRLTAREISMIWRGGRDLDSLPVEAVSLPGPDEDVVTMSIEAAQNAIDRADIDKQSIRAIYVGSESHPYAVKTTGSIVTEVLGLTPHTMAADFQFACKAGSEAMQAGFGLVAGGMADYVVGIGVDTAQARPRDELEYTAAAGAAAVVIGPAEQALAVLQGSYSYVTDTPDFYRRAYKKYPEHGNRFTGGPGYFHHIQTAVTTLLEEMQLRPEDFSAAVFHQPNVRFPRKIARQLGFRDEQIETGLLAQKVGNTYSSSAMLGFSAILDKARPGDRILLATYGSGAGSDVFCFSVTEKIDTAVQRAPLTLTYVDRTLPVDYLTYARLKGKINNN